jgi:ankyrin repeat protein
MITVSKVYDACKNGDVQFLHDFLNSDLYKNSNEVSTEQMLMLGCMKNHLDIVKCIFESHEARKGMYILKEIRELVKITCEKGYFELTKYLLEQPELKDENAKPEAPMMAALYCCSCGHLEILKYIVDSFPDEPMISKGMQNGNLLVAACEDGHI